jgi:nucleoside-diphosphate-sugar epimerase
LKKKILIIGSSGYLGNHLKVKLSKKYSIISTHKKNKKLVDICDYSKLDNYININKKIEYLINCSGQYSKNLKRFRNITIRGNKNIIKTAKKFNIKVILCSTTSIYGNKKDDYINSKLLAENLYIKSGIDYKILRIGNVYDSALKKKGLLNNLMLFFNNKIKKIEIKNSNIYRNFIHINDFCNLVLLVIRDWKKNKKKVFVLSSENLKIKKIISYFITRYPLKKMQKQNFKLGNTKEISILVKNSLFAYKYFRYTRSISLLKTIRDL